MPYLGASPRNINTRSVIDHQEYLGSQADTSTNSGYYTFYVNYTPGNVSVVIRGVHMASSDYTATNGTDVRISTSTITLANDDVIEIIGYGIPSSQILERSDVNITGGQAVNLTQVGASSYKVGNTEVIDSSGNLISGTLGANVSFANIADDAISGDKIHSGTISSSTLDGIKLKSSGDSITKSDGTTAVLSESGGAVTLTADKVIATQGLGGTPAFSAYMGSNQTVSHATSTKLNFDTEEFDTNNNFDTTTYRFTPTVAGYYQIIVVSSLQSPTETHRISSVIWKNSVQYINGATCAGAAGTWPSSIASTILYMNGSTDYVEGYVFIAIGSGTGTVVADYSFRSQFSGVLVRAA
jgi:hypothetical protein